MFKVHEARPTRANKHYWLVTAMAGLLCIAASVYSVSAQAASRSISEWVSCTGTADDTSGAMAAFSAAKNGAFTLIVDCPVFLHSGLAVDRGIFIDNETTVQFTSAGKFYVDNMFHPAFIIANSFDINLVDWNVEWEGSVPVNPDFGGYELGGKWVTSPHPILSDGPRSPRRSGARYRIERYQRLRQFTQAELHHLFGRQLHQPSTRRLHGPPAFVRADGVQCLCVF
jgi:hypothetical protein